MRCRFVGFCLLSLSLLFVPPASAQPPVERTPSQSTTVERVDAEIASKIKQEGLERSKVMETISFLTDVHGPRLTGSPITKAAGEWTKERLAAWGLENPRLEPWGPFGRGWTLDGFTANLVVPNFSSLIAYPKAWSPSTPQPIRGEPIYLDAKTSADLDKYRGKLHRRIVLLSPPRDVAALFEPPAIRKTEADLLALANAEPASARRRGPRTGGPTSGPGGSNAPASAVPSPTAPASASPSDPKDVAKANTAADPKTTAETKTAVETNAADPRAALQLQSDKWKLIYDEGAAVVLEPGRGDGGTVFVSAVTLPRRADAARGNGAEMTQATGPRPWSADAPEIIPQVVVAAEHYNRLVRMVEKDAHPEIEIDIAARYYTNDLNSFNVLAEIPGTDLKDEVVMLGAHFDSWHAGTGATDNAVGCGVALEAVRILKAIGAQPRRTIRIGLWTGEEQGLFGSRAYVSKHLGRASTNTREGAPAGNSQGSASARIGDGDSPRREPPRQKITVTAEYEKFSAYFNLDNGTGKIRGIYLQGNEPLRPLFRSWLSPFAEMGATTIAASNTGGTDHLSFDGIGLPGFQFIQDQIEYDTRTHHSSMDVYERVQTEDAKQAAIIMATFVYQAAVRDAKIARKPLDAELILESTPAAAESAEATVLP